jgi:hypothetical protein
MLFDNLPTSKPAARRSKSEPIFGVGWHAYVNWPQPACQLPRPVPMTDAAGKPLANDLADGQEVEILSWRPRAREGLAYQVRRLGDGSEWWIAAVYLRCRREAHPAADNGSELHSVPLTERR